MILSQENYVDKAEKVIKSLAAPNKMGRDMITTSQIRNLLAMTADIYNEVCLSLDETLSEEILGKIQYLRVRFVYEAGRDPRHMKDFVEKAEILKCLDEIGNSKSRYLLFSSYMEALVAYHKYYGGRD